MIANQEQEKVWTLLWWGPTFQRDGGLVRQACGLRSDGAAFYRTVPNENGDENRIAWLLEEFRNAPTNPDPSAQCPKR